MNRDIMNIIKTEYFKLKFDEVLNEMKTNVKHSFSPSCHRIKKVKEKYIVRYLFERYDDINYWIGDHYWLTPLYLEDLI